MNSVHARVEPPGVADTAFRVVEAGQRVLLDRLDLARLDLMRLLTLSARTAVALAAGTVLLSGAWCACVVALALRLQIDFALSLPLSLLIVAIASALAGLAVIGLGIVRVRAFELSAITPALEADER
jgi:hypothetical protein